VIGHVCLGICHMGGYILCIFSMAREGDIGAVAVARGGLDVPAIDGDALSFRCSRDRGRGCSRRY